MSAALVILATRVGPGISPDSTIYLSTGLHLAENGRLANFDGEQLSLFPPGMPGLIALLSWIGVEPTSALRLINALAAAVTVFLAYRLTRRVWPVANGESASAWPAVAVALLVALSTGTLTVYTMLWTEPIFCVVVLTVLLRLVDAPVHGRLSGRGVAAIVALTAIATSMRWVGVVLAPTIVFGLLLVWSLMGSGRVATAQFLRALLVGAAAVLPFLVLVAANVVTGHPPMGPRLPSAVGPVDVLVDIALLPGRWLIGGEGSDTAVLVVDVVVILLVTAGSVSSVRAVAAGDPRAGAAGLLLIWCGLYWSALVFSQLTTAIDRVDVRLSSPVAVPTLVLAAIGVRAVSAGLPRAFRLLGRALVVAVAVVAGAASGAQALDWSETGIGFDSVDAAGTYGFAARAAADGASLVVSDQPWLTWWLTRAEPVVPTPQIFYHVEGTAEVRADALARQVADARHAVLFLLRVQDGADRAVTLSDLRAAGIRFDLTRVTDTYAVYRLTAGP